MHSQYYTHPPVCIDNPGQLQHEANMGAVGQDSAREWPIDS